MTLPRSVLRYGEDEPLPTQTLLRAGPLSLIYEAGDLRYVRLGGREILRRIYVAVRDRNWDTAPAEISDLQMDIGDDHFAIRYSVVNRLNDLNFTWQGMITGDVHGTIRFSMDGVARSTFLRNRIGFCVLHPMSCAGAVCRITHVDGMQETARFPEQIAPQLIIDGSISPVSPFEEMASLAHEVGPGLWATVQFEGEIFETEDQRNWTDASYKTYGTPLRLPFPAKVLAGTKIRQNITLSLAGLPPADDTARETEPTITVVHGQSHPLPKVGLRVASPGQPLESTAVSRLRALNLEHLRLELDLSSPIYMDHLRQAAWQAEQLDTLLAVALFLSDRAEAELRALASQLTPIRSLIARWLIFHRQEATTSARWVDLARTILSTDRSVIPIGAGTNAYFTDLNRHRPDTSVLDFVTYSLNPQVHAFDNTSLVEALSTQAATVESARQFCSDVPIVVGPVTLKPRFNPNATAPESGSSPDALPTQVDVRQMSLFGAAWTLGSLKYLCESGVEAVTYFETTGWCGVMETAVGSPLPDRFRAIPGAVFPLYHVLADVGDFAGGNIVVTEASHPLLVEGLSLSKGHRTRTLAANLSPSPQSITVRNLPEIVRLSTLDEMNVVAAMTNPERYRKQAGIQTETDNGALSLTLLPYAVARIDSG